MMKFRDVGLAFSTILHRNDSPSSKHGRVGITKTESCPKLSSHDSAPTVAVNRENCKLPALIMLQPPATETIGVLGSRHHEKFRSIKPFGFEEGPQPRETLIRHAQKALLTESVTSSLICQVAAIDINPAEQLKLRLLVGLLKFSHRDYIGCFDDMNRILTIEPDNYLALRYRATCSEKAFSISFVSSAFPGQSLQEAAISSFNLVNEVQCDSEDLFGRTMKVCMLDTHQFHKRITDELETINAENPSYRLSRTALCLHLLRMGSYWGGEKYYGKASDIACEALRLDFSDDIAYSVLWWTTAGQGKDEFLDIFSRTFDDRGERRDKFKMAYLNRKLMLDLKFSAQDRHLQNEIFIPFLRNSL